MAVTGLILEARHAGIVEISNVMPASSPSRENNSRQSGRTRFAASSAGTSPPISDTIRLPTKPWLAYGLKPLVALLIC